jgi:serine/threonine protein kinase
VSTPPPKRSRTDLGRSQIATPIARLGDYYLIKKIARGGMGVIFLAKRLGVGGFEKTFVIKCMLDSLAGSQEFVAMFFDEARLAARLAHPNIAQIYDFGMIDGHYYIAMEHIPGEDVSSIIGKLRESNQSMPVGLVLRTMLDVCSGLDYAHTLCDNGIPLEIIHRDISPSNVMVSYQGAVKLLDFGIAKATSRLSETKEGSVKGKLSFLAPEQISESPVDARADLFSLGITFYALLAKRHPFQRESEVATMHAILHDEAPDPRKFRDDIPEEVVAILRRALERDPGMRYRSASHMGAALRTAMASIAPGTTTGDISAFMLSLFGRQAMEERSHVPNVSEASLADLGTQPPILTTIQGLPVLTTDAASASVSGELRDANSGAATKGAPRDQPVPALEPAPPVASDGRDAGARPNDAEVRPPQRNTRTSRAVVIDPIAAHPTTLPTSDGVGAAMDDTQARRAITVPLGTPAVSHERRPIDRRTAAAAVAIVAALTLALLLRPRPSPIPAVPRASSSPSTSEPPPPPPTITPTTSVQSPPPKSTSVQDVAEVTARAKPASHRARRANAGESGGARGPGRRRLANAPTGASPSDAPVPLKGDVLQAVVKKAHPHFAACFERYAAELPGATGKVTVEVAVASSGRISSTRVVLPGFSSAPLAGCLEAQAERLRFPRHPDREIRFAFPLVYRTRPRP